MAFLLTKQSPNVRIGSQHSEKTRIEIRSPAKNKGRATLGVDDDISNDPLKVDGT